MSDRITRLTRAVPGATPARRITAFVAALAIAAGVVASTSGALSTSAVEARDAARAATVTRLVTAHTASLATLRTAGADSRRAAAVTSGTAELVRARAVLASSAGKAADTGRDALAAAIGSLESTLAGSTAYRVTAALVSLKESEKAVTDSVAAFEAAEQKRLAAEAAAAAAAVAAAEYQTSHAVKHVVSTRSASPAVKASAPHYAPGVTSTPPDNSGCGPCPGATLVLTSSGYWGCP